MGSVFNRGSRDKPNWYVKYRDTDGRWKMVPSHQPSKPLARRFLDELEARIAAGQVGLQPRWEAPKCGPLLDQWMETLRNRNAADDRARIKKHLVPVFAERRLSDVTVKVIMEWLEDMRSAGKLSPASQRMSLNHLSRFFSWCIERELIASNPVRMIPVGKRPQQAVKSDQPWLNDDDIVRKLMVQLPRPANLMFYLGNRSGLRLGECAGLRMSDLAFVDEHVIRVRFSYDGPLKEDKKGTGKVKWVPAAVDTRELLEPWLAERRQQGAGPEDLVFPTPNGRCYSRMALNRIWREAAPAMGVKMTWYECTRHSFVSRNLEAGASLDEVSAAVGHSSPQVTKRYYDHFVRKVFSPLLRAGLAPQAGQGEPRELPPQGPVGGSSDR